LAVDKASDFYGPHEDENFNIGILEISFPRYNYISKMTDLEFGILNLEVTTVKCY
jgi:hypothetical protein